MDKTPDVPTSDDLLKNHTATDFDLLIGLTNPAMTRAGGEPAGLNLTFDY